VGSLAGKPTLCQFRTLVVRPDPTMGCLFTVRSFVETLEGRAKPLSSPEEGIKLVRIVYALYRSAREQTPINAGGI
jgi:predicted dehydrogenase